MIFAIALAVLLIMVGAGFYNLIRESVEIEKNAPQPSEEIAREQRNENHQA